MKFIGRRGLAILCMAALLVTGITVVPKITAQAEDPPGNLTSITWRDFGITDDSVISYNKDNWGQTDKSLSGKNLIGSSFRGTMCFQKTEGKSMWFQYGGSSSSSAKGIRFTMADSTDSEYPGCIRIFDMANNGSLLGVINPTTAGLTETTFNGVTFELGIDLWQPSSDSNDLKMIVFINGTQYNETAYTISNGATQISEACYMLVAETDTINLTVDAEVSPEGLTKIGWSDIGIEEGTYSYTNGGFSKNATNASYSLKNTSFRGDITFTSTGAVNENGLGTGLVYGDYRDGWQLGLNLIPLSDGTLKVMNTSDGWKVYDTLDPVKAGITSFLGEKFELGIDSWVDGTDVKFNIFINGEQYNKTSYTWSNGASNQHLYNYLTVGLFVMGANDKIAVSYPEVEKEVSPEGLTKISWEDFGVSEAKTFTNSDQVEGGVISRQALSLKTLIGTSFRGVTKFNRADTTKDDTLMIAYGGTGYWDGIRVTPSADKLVFQAINLDKAQYPVLASVAISQVSGLDSFLGQEFELGIDLWEESGSVKMNVFINGTQVTNTAAVWEDAATDNQIGNFNNPNVAGSNDSIYAEPAAEASCNLDTTPAGYLLSGEVIRVNDSEASSTALTTVGDYHVVVTDSNGVTATNVGCYKIGDAHVDGIIDIRDIVAVKKMVSGQTTTSVARRKAADLNGDNVFDSNDIETLRTNVLDVAKATSNTVYAYSLSSDSDEMPIGGFSGPYDFTDLGEEHVVYGEKVNLITDEVYQKIAECGITFLSGTAHVQSWTSDEKILKQLALTEKYGLGMFVSDSTMLEGTAVSTEEEFAARIAKYSNFKSYKGLFLADEPTYVGTYGSASVTSGADGDLTRESAANLAKLVNSYGNLTSYANLFPLRNSMVLDSSLSDTEAYRNYLNYYCINYQPKFISYDYYPFEWKTNVITNKGYTGTNAVNQYAYFKNLAIVRDVANQYQIPFWTHIGSGDGFDINSGSNQYVNNESNPSEGKFKWQINVELAFGAKGIQYFPLVQPSGYELGSDGTVYYERNGLINKNGETNVWYDYAKEMNQQIKNMDHVLMNSVSKGLLVTGDYASENMAAAQEYGMPIFTSFSLDGDNPTVTGLSTDETGDQTYGAIAGCFDHQGKSAVYVVNYNVEGASNITVSWDRSSAYQLIDKTGASNCAAAASCTISLEAGEAALLVFE